tara:strand:+ start:3086 stop:3448 length:363 start_codon:yes stop_codon:yes gene_type:complete
MTRDIKWEREHGVLHFGGGGAPPDNSAAMMAMMQQQDERNRVLYAENQANIQEMQERQAGLERANTMALQKEEEELKMTAQRMEDEARGESTTQAYAEDDDMDTVITGFYNSLGGDDRPA